MRPLSLPLPSRNLFHEGRGRITRTIKKCQKRKRIQSQLHRKINLPVDPLSSISPPRRRVSERKLREREKINLAFPPLTRTARSHGLSSRPSITSFPIPYPSGHTTRPACPSLATAYPRTRGFTRFERVQPGRLLGSVPYKLHGRRFASCVYLFFSPLSSYFSALLVREDTRRTTTITTTTDDEDDDDNNNNDRPGSEAWPVAEIP